MCSDLVYIIKLLTIIHFRKYDDDEDESADEEVSRQMQEVIILKMYNVKSQNRMKLTLFTFWNVNVPGLIEHN